MDAEEEEEEDDEDDEDEGVDGAGDIDDGSNPPNQDSSTLDDTAEEADMEAEANKENTSYSSPLS